MHAAADDDRRDPSKMAQLGSLTARLAFYPEPVVRPILAMFSF